MSSAQSMEKYTFNDFYLFNIPQTQNFGDKTVTFHLHNVLKLNEASSPHCAMDSWKDAPTR